jgi:hypothetical protein
MDKTIFCRTLRFVKSSRLLIVINGTVVVGMAGEARQESTLSKSRYGRRSVARLKQRRQDRQLSLEMRSAGGEHKANGSKYDHGKKPGESDTNMDTDMEIRVRIRRSRAKMQ